MKRLAFTWLLTCCAAAPVRALSPPSTIYYAGEAVNTMEDGKISRHAYVIARTSDPEKNEIRELAVAFDPRTEKYAEHASTITVKDGSKLSMSEPTGVISGEGELTGEPWRWTYLHAVFTMKGTDFKIDDVNCLAEYETSIQGHKDFYRGGKRFMREDVVLHAVDKATYEAKRAELLK